MTKKKQIIFSSLLGIVLLGVIFWPKHREIEPLDEVDVVDSVEVREIVYKYGIPVDDYDVDFGVVNRNQNLSSILDRHGVGRKKVYQLTEASKNVFDVREIRSGQTYAVFSSRDSVPEVNYFVYERNPRSYVVFDLLNDSVSLGYNPVEWQKKSVKGRVESSPWNAMVACGADPCLAVELANIYGWSIDFFGLKKEDEFRVLYEQESIEGKSISNFNIIGAAFKHADSVYYAIPFMQGEKMLFYNEHGKSLEGAFLKAPLDFFRISSRFSNSRYHPVLKRYRPHHGVDYAAPVGTPVYAVGSGVVIAKAFQAGGGGNYVKIKHNSMYTTVYMHLSKFASGLKVGKTVEQKEVIGYVGSTGIATGPHLDFRVFENGKPINPLTIRSQPKQPVDDENMPRFTMIRDTIIEQLRRL